VQANAVDLDESADRRVRSLGLFGLMAIP